MSSAGWPSSRTEGFGPQARSARRAELHRARHRDVVRRFSALIASCVLVLVAAGCRLDTKVNVTAKPDGSGTVSVTAIADAELVRRAPNAIIEFSIADATAAGWETDGVQKPADGTRVITLTKRFGTPEEADRVLAELSGTTGPFSALHLAQKRSFGDVKTTLTGSAGLEGGIGALSDSAIVGLLGGQQPLATVTGPLSEQFTVTLSTSFPGKATTATELKVPIDAGAPAAVDMRARALDLRAQSARRNSWIAFGLAGVAAVAFVTLMWRRREKRRW
jgi:hypothetical protein